MPLNESTSNFLKRYWSGVKSPEYAVLLSGNWGSGKTWFIQNFLETHTDQGKCFYVSLYGVTAFEQIESEFFRQVHPVLSSGAAKVLGKLLKGVLKTTINFDLNSDGKADGNVSAGIPTESLFEKVSVPEGALLVFDDIERCAIPINELLGYINQFVEHGGFKAILIANEEEILSRAAADGGLLYRHVKEKLIGHSFEIVPDLEAAFASFAEALPESKSRELVRIHAEVIKRTYVESGYRNLRALKQGITEFDIFFRDLKSEITDCLPLMNELFATFFAYTFELRSGSISVPELKELSSMRLAFSASPENEDQKRINEVSDKYSGINFFTTVLSPEHWRTIFTHGYVPIKDINECLLNSRHFQDANKPTWVKAWWGYQLSDYEFPIVLRQLKQEWDDQKFIDLGEFFHVCSLFLKYSKLELYSKTEDEVVLDCKCYVDELVRTKNLQQDNRIEPYFNEYSGYSGLGFSDCDQKKFNEIKEYLVLKQREMVLDSYPEVGGHLLELMKTNLDEFIRKIAVMHDGTGGDLARTAIFSFVPPEKFVEGFMALEGGAKLDVVRALKRRYGNYGSTEDIGAELPWIKKVWDLFDELKNERKGLVSSYAISLFLSPPYLGEAISSFESKVNAKLQSEKT
jgi:KAP family P-loop domain